MFRFALYKKNKPITDVKDKHITEVFVQINSPLLIVQPVDRQKLIKTTQSS